MAGTAIRSLRNLIIFSLALGVQWMGASTEPTSLIDITYPVASELTLEEAKHAWLQQFLQEYPDSGLKYENLTSYVMSGNVQDGKQLTVSCNPEDFSGLTLPMQQCWVGALCDDQQVTRLKSIVGNEFQINRVENSQDMLDLKALDSWVKLSKLNPKAKGYRLQCQDEKLLWTGFDDSFQESDWDPVGFPCHAGPSGPLAEVTAELDRNYIVQVHLGSQAEALGLLLALKNVEQLSEMEIVGANQGVYSFSFKLKGSLPEDMKLWAHIEKLDEHNYRAEWNREQIDEDQLII